jgi:hypothetical protein
MEMLEYPSKDLDSIQQTRIEKAVNNANFIYNSAEDVSKKINEISSIINEMLEFAIHKSYVQEGLLGIRNTLYMANMKMKVIKEISKNNM